MRAPIFVALDFPNTADMWTFLEKFPESERPAVKVGMELYYAYGPSLVRELKDAGFTVFLDLKLYDIPNTVQHAIYQLAQLGVDYITVHAAGGIKMMRAALDGAQSGAAEVGVPTPKLLAITQLTSFSEIEMQETQLVTVSLADSVVHLATLAQNAGMAGTISAASESQLIHDATSADFLSITPGIRLLGDDQGDQSRVLTPGKAAQMSADGLVVGRSITQAVDPYQAYQRVVAEFEGGLND